MDILNEELDHSTLNKLDGYELKENICEDDIGHLIRYIKKVNNKYYAGGFIASVDTGAIKIVSYNRQKSWHIYDIENYIFLKKIKRKSNMREALESLLRGEFTVTKLN